MAISYILLISKYRNFAEKINRPGVVPKDCELDLGSFYPLSGAHYAHVENAYVC